MQIGIDIHQYLVFEGDSNYGRALWPAPVIAPAIFGPNAENLHSELPDSNRLDRVNFLFREDHYDPVTRIRRGRFYHFMQSQQSVWQVNPHPVIPSELNQTDEHGSIQRTLYTYWGSDYGVNIHAPNIGFFAAIGTKEGAAYFRVIDREIIATGEVLVTLKARSSYGILPELGLEALSENERSRLEQHYQRVLDTTDRLGPESIVDRCYNAVLAILRAKYRLATKEEPGNKADLGMMIQKYRGIEELKRYSIVLNAADSIRVLHSRDKPNVQDEYSPREIEEEDGQFALQSLAIVLRDIGFAK